MYMYTHVYTESESARALNDAKYSTYYMHLKHNIMRVYHILYMHRTPLYTFYTRIKHNFTPVIYA